MSLLDAIATAQVRVRRHKVRTLSEVPVLTRTVAALTERTASIPPVEQLFEVADRLQQATEGGDWTGLSRRDIRRAPLCLWLKERPLARVAGFIKQLLETLQRFNRKGAYRSLITAYIRDFAVDDPVFAVVAKELRTVAEKWAWVWKERSTKHELFDPDQAPRRIAEYVIGSEHPVPDAMKELGISVELMSGGLARAAYLEALKFVTGQLKSDMSAEGAQVRMAVERVQAWTVDGNALRYSGTVPAMVDALLLPWAGRTAPEELQQAIQEFLIGRLRDPRMNRAAWHGVSNDAMQIIRRWLAQASLDQYLDVVDEITKDREARYMWQFRRAFWRAYFEAGVLEDAWVVFSWKGAQVARDAFESTAEFGNLRSGQVQPNHAVLIMRIGGLTIADWSHSGKCHIWKVSNKNAPTLYEKNYTRADMTTGSDNGGIAHTSSRTANWQRRVHNYIRDHTGITIPEHDYMPKQPTRRG